MGTNLFGSSSQGPGPIVPYEGRGEKSDIRELYRKDSTKRWEPLDRNRVSVPKVDSDFNIHAIVARYQAGTGPTDLESFIVHSPYLISLLAKVFDGYPGVYTSLAYMKFRRPFDPFYHRWQDFLDAAEQETGDTKVSRHVKLLQDLIEGIIRPIKARVDDLLTNGLMDYAHIWALFPPNTEIYTHSYGYARLYRVASLDPQRTLQCKYIDCRGSKLAFVDKLISPRHFDGFKPIQELEYIPVSMHQDQGVRQMLSTRGHKFEGLNGIHYRSFTGVVTLPDSQTNTYRKVTMHNTRVIMDPAYSRTNSREVVGTSNLDAPSDDPTKKLDENDYALCTPTIKGFSMTHKAWAFFPVDGVNEIAWSGTALEKLVLHEDYKKIILAFVQAQLSNADDFDDIIQGKGQGIIMLFQGPAGVGKTLTAESVAEEMKCPLYAMSSGELGDTASDVEGRLRNILQLCTRWKAVLLLDECDVFLEKRSSANMTQNKLVAVFLRLLEYYQGCLMLTTNRVQDIDPAFESRIHLTIEYPPLHADARYTIWSNFLHGFVSGTHASQTEESRPSIRESDVRDLAKRDLNGRQIKNVVKTSRLLAARDGVVLNLEHIYTVLKARGPRLVDGQGV